MAGHDVSEASAAAAVRTWVTGYRAADQTERAIVDAALRCISRWGLGKTSLDDVAREAGMSRATLYRTLPGGKARLVDLVIRHELGRSAHNLQAAVDRTETLEDLLCLMMTAGIRFLTEHGALQHLVAHEPEIVLPHFAFHRLERVFDHTHEAVGPHLARFLPPGDVRPAVELLVRLVLTYSFFPSDTFDPHDPASIRRLVRAFLIPAVTSDRPYQFE